MSGPPSPEKSLRWLYWLLALLGGACLIVCCGGVLMLLRMGFRITESEIKVLLQDNLTVKEEIGEIVSLEIDWPKSMAEEDGDVMVYRVRGTKGQGEMTVNHVTNEEGAEVIRWAKLRTAAGKEIDLAQ